MYMESHFQDISDQLVVFTNLCSFITRGLNPEEKKVPYDNNVIVGNQSELKKKKKVLLICYSAMHDGALIEHCQDESIVSIIYSLMI